MHPASIVILSGNSLFIEGVASRLQQYPNQVEIEIVNSSQPGALEIIQAIRPSAVILDATEKQTSPNCPISTLLSALPALKIVRLDSQQKHFQIVTSEQHSVDAVQDLLELIAPQARS